MLRIDTRDYPTCDESGKISYGTKQQAYKVAKKLQGPRGRQLMDVYKCKWCKGYHLTHRNTKRV